MLTMWKVKLGISVVVFVLYIHKSHSLPESFSRREDPRELSPEEAEVANKARQEIAKILKKNLIRFLAVVTVEDNHRKSRQFPFPGIPDSPTQHQQSQDPNQPPEPLVPHQQPQQPQPQQEDEDEEEDTATTKKTTEKATRNPDTLPQVAALLGAIFSNTLNLTSVVDRAFFLLPNAIRSQVSGLFKVLTGHPVPGDHTTPLPLHKKVSTTPFTVKVTESSTEPITEDTLRSSNNTENINSTSSLSGDNSTLLEATTLSTKATTKERVTNPDIPAFGSVFNPRRKNQGTTTNVGLIPLGLTKTPPITRHFRAAVIPAVNDIITEDEIAKTEKEIREDAELYVRFTKGKEPGALLEPLQKMIHSREFNMTAVENAMPDLFKGARRMYSVLQSLGQFVGLVDEV